MKQKFFLAACLFMSGLASAQTLEVTPKRSLRMDLERAAAGLFTAAIQQ